MPPPAEVIVPAGVLMLKLLVVPVESEGTVTYLLAEVPFVHLTSKVVRGIAIPPLFFMSSDVQLPALL